MKTIKDLSPGDIPEQDEFTLRLSTNAILQLMRSLVSRSHDDTSDVEVIIGDKVVLAVYTSKQEDG